MGLSIHGLRLNIREHAIEMVLHIPAIEEVLFAVYCDIRHFLMSFCLYL